jgi:hypothetical protein
MSELSADTKAAGARRDAAFDQFAALCTALARKPLADRKAHGAAVRAISDAGYAMQHAASEHTRLWDRDQQFAMMPRGIRLGELAVLLTQVDRFMRVRQGKNSARHRDHLALMLTFIARDVSGAILVLGSYLAGAETRQRTPVAVPTEAQVAEARQALGEAHTRA